MEKRPATLLLVCAQCLLATSAYALDGGTLRLNTFNDWEAFEIISQGDDPAGSPSYAMPGIFDGAGAWLVDPSTLRVLVNHETTDASISEVDIDLGAFKSAISHVIAGGSPGVSFVIQARQAYDRWHNGTSWSTTSSASNTSFYRFCSGQAYAPNTFGVDRGFVDEIYITGEEGGSGGNQDRLFAIDSLNRDLYQLSGTVGSEPGAGIGGLPFDHWENAALLDTGETSRIALMLSPDGGTQNMVMYIGAKGLDKNGAAAGDFLSRNGLAYGSWYYLNSSLPGSGTQGGGYFDTSSSGALNSGKLEDVDTSPSHPWNVVLGDQTSGVFTFDFDLKFSGSSFLSGSGGSGSSFSITKIGSSGGGLDSLGSPDNVDWTAATSLVGSGFPAGDFLDGLIFVNEDNSTGEIHVMTHDGTIRERIASTTTGKESTGIFDVSEMVGYRPGSILITNNQGSPASMSVLINPNATAAPPAEAVPVSSGLSRLVLVMSVVSLGLASLLHRRRSIP